MEKMGIQSSFTKYDMVKSSLKDWSNHDEMAVQALNLRNGDTPKMQKEKQRDLQRFEERLR